MRITFDGRTFEGTALQIVQSMRSIATFKAHMTIGEYVDFVAHQISALGTPIEVNGDNDEAKAASLVEAMLATGMARKS